MNCKHEHRDEFDRLDAPGRHAWCEDCGALGCLQDKFPTGPCEWVWDLPGFSAAVLLVFTRKQWATMMDRLRWFPMSEADHLEKYGADARKLGVMD